MAHFEILADGIKRRRNFDQKLVGWTFLDAFQSVNAPCSGVIPGKEEAPGVNGGLLPHPAARPPQEQGINAFVCTVAAEDCNSAHERIIKAGGMAALPKMALPGHA